MSPPTEQLIRDYLNRLSVAARGRLSTDDRRALVTRTHDFIERNASRSGPATALQIGALLSTLGDPGALIDQEVARLAAERGQALAPPDDQPSGLAGRLLRRNSTVGWPWPAVAGQPDRQSQLLHGNGGNGAQPSPAQASAPAAVVPRQPGPADRDAAEGGSPAEPGGQADAAPPVRPVWPPDAAGPGKGDAEAGQPAEGAASAGPDGAGGAPPGPAPGESATRPGAAVTEPARGRGPSLPAPVQTWMRGLPSRAMALSRRHPLEFAALVLLGLGGVIYPPVWLLGAGLALAAREWDYRDKWAGIGGPVVLLILGTSLGVALGSSHHQLGGYLHEVWVYLNILSRICAVAGTWYLGWRLTHARPVPDVPPWNRQRRLD
jgi:hypothetical protein